MLISVMVINRARFNRRILREYDNKKELEFDKNQRFYVPINGLVVDKPFCKFLCVCVCVCVCVCMYVYVCSCLGMSLCDT